MPITEENKIKIRDIIKKNGDFLRFRIVDCGEGKFSLMMKEQPLTEKWGTSLSIETCAKRLEQLANEILTYLQKEAKLKEWKPTMQEFQKKLEELYGVEMWFIDWVRNAVTMRQKENVIQARRIYEWLKSNETWLYADK